MNMYQIAHKVQLFLLLWYCTAIDDVSFTHLMGMNNKENGTHSKLIKYEFSFKYLNSRKHIS